jgi:pimeloyl-ACP methyl ester carboxylesterase
MKLDKVNRMENPRRYGKSPFNIAVIHGGPGAGGQMAPVALELSSVWGILEPIQTAASLEGQIDELKTAIKKNGDFPITLIGFSWGAWLSFIFAANYPALVKKVILIGSGPYEEKYVSRIQETRLNRLSKEDRTKLQSIIEILNNPTAEEKNIAFVQFETLFLKTDMYNPIISESMESKVIDCQVEIFQGVWKDADKLRRSGKLLELGKHIECAVVSIHGDYDPHPAEGVEKPLAIILKNFRFVLIKNCGHMPWLEREAKEKFYRILKEELF